MKGPRIVPAMAPDWSVPIAKPIRFLGVVVDTSETDAGLNPDIVPFTIRSSSNCQGPVANPMSTMTAAMPNPERSSIGLRPIRSESLPQNG
ncbi:hypothetical protein D3C84_1046720 [compost metagenome]